MPESENNVASGELGPALQMNALKQGDTLSHLLCFSSPQVLELSLQQLVG